MIHGDHELFLMFHAAGDECTFAVPSAPRGKRWRSAVDTSRPPRTTYLPKAMKSPSSIRAATRWPDVLWPCSWHDRVRPVASYYPLFFSLAGKLCVVIGGGKVAERKVQGLLKADARPRIISPKVTKGIRRLCERGLIEVVQREYREGDLEGAYLAFAATDSSEINERVRAESIRCAIPLNVADSPDQCDFIVPSVVRNGPVSIAISTSGLLPMLAKKLKTELEGALSADYGAYARRVGAFRKFLIEHVEDARKRREILKRVGDADVSEVSRMSLKKMKKRFLEEKEG